MCYATNMVKNKEHEYPCPVCGLIRKWHEPFKYLVGSYEICPCCYVEFGLDDFAVTHEELRAEWIANGSPWMGHAVDPQPPSWDWRKQLENIQPSEP